MTDTSAGPPLTTRVVKGLDAAREEARRWEALARDAAEPNVFAEPWFMLPSVVLAPDPEGFELFLAERGTELVGLIPLHRRRLHRRVPLERLTLYTNDFLPLSVPFFRRGHERDVADAFARHLNGESRVVSFGLERAATSGPTFLALAEAAREHGLVVESRKLYTRAFFDPREPVDEYVKKYVSRKKRDQVQRTAKKLGEQGTLSFDTFEGTPSERTQDELGRWVDEFLDLEASGWKGREGTAMRAHPRTEHFFRDLTRAAFERGRLHVVAMRLDGKPVAMKVNVLDAPTSYTYKVAYDEAFAKLSPGVLLEIESMKRVAALPGIRTMDSAGRGENPPFDWLWNERRPLGVVEMSTGRAASDLLLLGLPAAKWLRRRGKAAAGAVKARFAGGRGEGGNA